MKYFIYQYDENKCVRLVINGVHRHSCGAYEIERRPRGASRRKAAPTSVSGQSILCDHLVRLVDTTRF
ncbi:hypothetical protein OC926_02405 [Pseudomonas peradeniyensis]|uniref:hypothetical protein n=1 Tax=Pseudomonas peradeniyensis TaxID=2745488 RepID=UPI0021D4A64D|nr:hypothetical protein [Pseudomonas peradeniyensis]MCU7278684.1 hypothetical protein [Pseudomonas peradeniyensis]